MVTRKLILAGALLALACSRSPATPPPATQTPARAADNTKNIGPGYYGGAPENVNRPSVSPSEPGGVGGGPASETMEHSDMDHSGVDPSSGAPTTSAPSPEQSETDMTGAPAESEKPKSNKKTK